MLSIDATARLVGHACWVEGACFALLGAWVPSVPEPAAKLLVARHSRHHGGHAELLAGTLPATRAHEPTALAAPADPGWPRAVAAAQEPAGTPERLAGVYQVLVPAVVSGYDRTLERLSPWSDGPVARRLRLVVEEERADLAEGLALLEGLLDSAGAADRVARHRARVEAALPGS